MDTNSAALLSLGAMFSVAAGNFMNTNFWWAVVCGLIAIGCYLLREFVKQ